MAGLLWARRRLLCWVVTAFMVTLVSSTPIAAQVTPPPDNGNGNGNGNGNDTVTPGGVIVDAEGVVRMQQSPDPTGRLAQQRLQAAKAKLDPKIAAKSVLRKVSLNRLEAQIAELAADNRRPSNDMKHLAGLTRVQYIFYYPETRDIVLAGPAEAYGHDEIGRVRGAETGSPTLHLDDLVVALRTFFGNEAKNAPLISVSIDPTKEGLNNMQNFLKQMGSRATPNDTQFIVNGLRENLGLQTIRLTGVPTNSHFAKVLVEADYRMKLIGIGLENPGVKMASYVERTTPAAVSRNALQRWYFVPNYECVRVAADDLAAELVGSGVKLISADELVAADGSRQKAGTVDAASKAFTESFTKNYAGIAAASPVFGQLRNVIDLSIVAAFMHQHKMPQTAEWPMKTFLDEKAYPVEVLNVPKQVETAVASVWRGNKLMTPVGGGVKIQPRMALESQNLLEDKEGKVAKARTATELKDLKKDQWWWD